MMKKFLLRITPYAIAFGAVAILPTLGFAQGFPWEEPTRNLVDSFQNLAAVLGVAAIILFGLSYAFGEGGGVFRRGASIVVGLSIAVNADRFMAMITG
jgi:type IV secretory pathway VirB2 component (pilin)